MGMNFSSQYEIKVPPVGDRGYFYLAQRVGFTPQGGINFSSQYEMQSSLPVTGSFAFVLGT